MEEGGEREGRDGWTERERGRQKERGREDACRRGGGELRLRTSCITQLGTSIGRTVRAVDGRERALE